MSAPTSPPERILVARSSHLGDVAETLPLIHALRAAWPDARIAWAIQPAFAPLVEPLVDEIIPFARDGGAAAWPRIRRTMARFGADLAIDAQGNWKSAFVVRLSGARRRFGFARSRWQEPLAGRALGVTPVPAADAPHLVERLLALAGALTGTAVDPRLDPGLTTEERDGGRAALGAALDGRNGTPLLLHPGVLGDPRTWPRERYAALLHGVAGRADIAPLVVTGPAEAETGRWLEGADAARVAGHLVGQRGLRALCALFAAAAERGARLITQDSGPAHVAASVGLGVVLVAGPEDPSRTGPWPVAEGEGSPHRLAAAPMGWRPGARWTPRATDTVQAADVLAAVQLD